MQVPSDVIAGILLRLPVKSLSRFKCLSKHWCSHISDPRFAKSHVDLVMIDKDIEHERQKLVLVLEEECEHERGKRLRFSSSFNSMYHVECEALASNDAIAVQLDFPLIKSSVDKVKFIGSLNGLLCVCLLPDNICLYNPVTTELKTIPKLNINADSNTPLNDSVIYGFGYDHSIDDYNIVKIMCESSVVYVYSLKTDTWRKSAQSFTYESFNSDPAVPLNGAVHWMFSRGEGELALRPRFIVAFNFAEGKFHELPQPSNAANNMIGVGILGGCLCLLTYNEDSAMKQQHFWVMKEYDMKESWTKVVVTEASFYLKPLSYLKKGETLLEIDGKLAICKPKEHTHTKVFICGIPRGRILEIGTYVESLVSPNNVWN